MWSNLFHFTFLCESWILSLGHHQSTFVQKSHHHHYHHRRLLTFLKTTEEEVRVELKIYSNAQFYESIGHFIEWVVRVSIFKYPKKSSTIVQHAHTSIFSKIFHFIDRFSPFLLLFFHTQQRKIFSFSCFCFKKVEDCSALVCNHPEEENKVEIISKLILLLF